ncbi:hypothetical protein CROQUDRAFT_86328 [Cronartium quercuum f. sp. fusiforme G11]|uniref:Uncharacterized protein n=1 Tax=Cronartium quercuum f. sp. fusiforme G11 TaxID=708437 RepID=A0A9P6NQV9_9BASI|nr:hypothetical protein CROQUDRAFT_86328 [Cronartium quercuum f. sp. fusiforme G11]
MWSSKITTILVVACAISFINCKPLMSKVVYNIQKLNNIETKMMRGIKTPTQTGNFQPYYQKHVSDVINRVKVEAHQLYDRQADLKKLEDLKNEIHRLNIQILHIGTPTQSFFSEKNDHILARIAIRSRETFLNPKSELEIDVDEVRRKMIKKLSGPSNNPSAVRNGPQMIGNAYVENGRTLERMNDYQKTYVHFLTKIMAVRGQLVPAEIALTSLEDKLLKQFYRHYTLKQTQVFNLNSDEMNLVKNAARDYEILERLISGQGKLATTHLKNHVSYMLESGLEVSFQKNEIKSLQKLRMPLDSTHWDIFQLHAAFLNAQKSLENEGWWELACNELKKMLIELRGGSYLPTSPSPGTQHIYTFRDVYLIERYSAENFLQDLNYHSLHTALFWNPKRWEILYSSMPSGGIGPSYTEYILRYLLKDDEHSPQETAKGFKQLRPITQDNQENLKMLNKTLWNAIHAKSSDLMIKLEEEFLKRKFDQLQRIAPAAHGLFF